MARLINTLALYLNCRRCLAGNGRRGVIFGRDVVGASRIGVLEQRPVGIEAKRRLEPGSVGHARGTEFVIDDDFLPGTRLHALDVARDFSQERHVLGDLIQALRRYVVAEFFFQFGGGHFLHVIFLVLQIRPGTPPAEWTSVGGMRSEQIYWKGQGAVGSHTGIPMNAYHGAMTQMP